MALLAWKKLHLHCQSSKSKGKKAWKRIQLLRSSCMSLRPSVQVQQFLIINRSGVSVWRNPWKPIFVCSNASWRKGTVNTHRRFDRPTMVVISHRLGDQIGKTNSSHFPSKMAPVQRPNVQRINREKNTKLMSKEGIRGAEGIRQLLVLLFHRKDCLAKYSWWSPAASLGGMVAFKT